MSGDLIEIFKIIQFLIMVDIFQTGNLLSRQIWKTKSTNQLDLFAKKVEYFWNKMHNQIEISNSIKDKLINYVGWEKIVRKRI